MAAAVTALHVARGREMRAIVEHDVARRGLSAAAAIESLAGYLGISVAAVELGIALAGEDLEALHRALEAGSDEVAS